MTPDLKQDLIKTLDGEEPTVRPALYVLPATVSRFGLPDGYARGVDTFEQAIADYEAGHAAKAGVKFIAVADWLRAPRLKTTFSDAFTRMRQVTYRNAALAFEEGNMPSAARKALTEALAKDPENAELLRTLIARFP